MNVLMQIRKELGMSRPIFSKLMLKSVCSIKFYETDRQKTPAEVIKRANRLKIVLDDFVEKEKECQK